MKHLLVCLLALLAAPAAAQVSTSKTVTITITSPAGVCSVTPAPAAAAGFTTQALCSDWTVAMAANWMGGCAVAGNGQPVNSGDQSGHNWWLNPWFSNTYQPCIATQVTDPVFSGTVLDQSWVTDSNAYNVGTELQSTAWFSTGTPNSGISFPNNAYYEMTFRMAPITKGTWGGIFTWPVLAQTDSSKEGIENDVIEMDVGQLGLMDAAIHNWPLSGPPGQFIWQGYGANNGGIGIGVPLSFDPNIYHTFGLLTTSDGVAAYQTCTFVDGVTNSCASQPIPGGWPVASEATLRYMLMMINACDFWNGTCNPNGTLQHMYVKDVKVWSCPTWATTQCNKPPAPTTINATDFCAANGGGDGSSGNPWQAACIQAAINAASNGNNVFLAAGNWELKISKAPVITGNKSINLVGAGSGNTFDAYGHPNNGQGGPVGPVTRIYTSGASGDGGGYITFGIYGQNLGTGNFGCANGSPGPSVSHLYIDGSQAQSAGNAFGSTIEFQGDFNGTLSFQSCPNATVNDIRVLSWTGGLVLGVNSPNTQFWVRDSANFVLQNSALIEFFDGSNYGGNQLLQDQEHNASTITNNLFYMFPYNTIYVDNVVYTANQTVMSCDSQGCASALGGFGAAGCSPAFCYANGGSAGSLHFHVTNSYFNSATQQMGLGGGVNDPNTSGVVNDLQWSGDWLFASDGNVGTCEWRLYDTACIPMTADSNGMQVNNMSLTNSSIIGSSSAAIDYRGNGCPGAMGANDGTGPADCPASTQKEMQCVNCTATNDYLQGPNNQYRIDSNSPGAVRTNTFCSGSTFSGCNTTGFTQAPTVTFTLGTASGGTVPFATTNFTAQYGAVKWLASTSSTTPTSGGQVGGATWSFVPPISLAAAHGNTIFMWVMDSANHISAPASAVVP